MPRVFGFCLVALVAAFVVIQPARAAGDLIDRFEPQALDDAERRLIQTALAAAGDFNGPLDGDWGPASQAALEAWTFRSFHADAGNLHAAALVLSFLDEVALDGWSFEALDGYGIALALPLGLLGPPEPEQGGLRRWSRHGSLTVLVNRFDADKARAWHAAARRADADPGPRRDAPDLLVTAGRLADGRGFHTRSDRTAEGWTTVYLASRADEAEAMGLVAASIRPGSPDRWELPPGGRLSRLIADAIAPEPGQDTALPPAPGAGAPVGAGAGSTGTGFYLGPRTLVTAAHVVEGCARVALADGGDLDLVASDAELDIAVLAAPSPAPRWLSLAPGRAARLGQRVHAVGFPYYAIAGTSLNLTSGNVSALAGVDDDPRFLSFSAPVQPGNSGGPLIDAHGAVVGLVVARLSEDFIIEATGTLPQNVNYALAEGELAGFLHDNGVAATPGGLGPFAVDDGAPEGIEAAIVPVICE
jgi:serine protease Do